ncbi:craniofacial development protein 2-like [Drosophila ficusphila]|uniref:craniofacial development protein 2-like n=1 Tax=Drosophila ficusphila TaxID=30025 RepID=UPI001C895415|nr:craniofacial development protein 2-like [Drosophila ficusphila]
MTTIRISKRTRIGQWNVRTLMEPSRLAQFELEMDKLQISIAGISEMRWKGSGATTTSNGNSVLHSGNNDDGRNGVGIYVSKRYKQTLISWNPISDRIIMARFRCSARHITIVQCYAPTEDASDDIKDDFYNSLTSTLTRIQRGDIKILMGDFNAKIGPNNTGLEPVMGRHGVGSRSNNGDRLIDLGQTSQMVIGGTVFPHKELDEGCTQQERRVN